MYKIAAEYAVRLSQKPKANVFLSCPACVVRVGNLTWFILAAILCSTPTNVMQLVFEDFTAESGELGLEHR